MDRIEVRAWCQDTDPDRAYERLAEFDQYVVHSDAVRAVEVDRTASRLLSHWEVNFRNGILIWTERDEFDDRRRAIRFQKVAGDPEHFDGEWWVEPGVSGCSVSFTAEFEIGIPTYGDVFDPLARRTLYDNVVDIIGGLFGTAVVETRAPTDRGGSGV